jgi:hypothetical protein
MTGDLNKTALIAANNNNMTGSHKTGNGAGSRRLSKDDQPLKQFRSRTESITSNTSENGQKQPSLYKTELCRSFEEHGSCRYGKKCQFAHSQKELRIINRHPKYKTEMCESFHTTGYCPYGGRCHFIHNVETSKSMRKIKSHDENLSESLKERNSSDVPFSLSNFESDWPKIDSSPLRLTANSRSLNSVGSLNSSSSIWRNTSESSFALDALGGALGDTLGGAIYSDSQWSGSPMDDTWGDCGGGLTLKRKSDLNPQAPTFGEDQFSPWEENRLPVFRHLSSNQNDAGKV